MLQRIVTFLVVPQKMLCKYPKLTSLSTEPVRRRRKHLAREFAGIHCTLNPRSKATG
jgi:hypothetical protein